MEDLLRELFRLTGMFSLFFILFYIVPQFDENLFEKRGLWLMRIAILGGYLAGLYFIYQHRNQPKEARDLWMGALFFPFMSALIIGGIIRVWYDYQRNK